MSITDTLLGKLGTCATAMQARLAQSGWTWSARTSALGTKPVTYAAAASISVIPVDVIIDLEVDARGVASESTRDVQIPESDIMPAIGDRLTDPDSTVWTVHDQPSSGQGWRRYTLQARDRKIRGRDRGRWAR